MLDYSADNGQTWAVIAPYLLGNTFSWQPGYVPPMRREGMSGIDFAPFIAAAVLVWGPLAAGAFLHGHL